MAKLMIVLSLLFFSRNCRFVNNAPKNGPTQQFPSQVIKPIRLRKAEYHTRLSTIYIQRAHKVDQKLCTIQIWFFKSKQKQ